MEALARRLRISDDESGGLEFPWPTLARQVRPMPGNLVIVTAAPGVGKSTWGLEWVVNLVSKDVPTLYLSLDTPLHDQAARLIARWNGIAVSDVQENIDDWIGWLTKLDLPLRFCDLGVTVDDIRTLVEAEAQWFGRYPALIVVDNMMDVVEEDSAAEYKRAFGMLHAIARETNSIVLALHHIKRGDDRLVNGLRAPSLGDGLYGGEHGTQIMLGLWRPFQDAMNVSILKNRMGTDAKDGSLFVSLSCDMSKSMVWEVA